MYIKFISRSALRYKLAFLLLIFSPVITFFPVFSDPLGLSSFSNVQIDEKIKPGVAQKIVFIPDVSNVRIYADMSNGSDENTDDTEDPLVSPDLNDVGENSPEWFKFFKSTCLRNCPPAALIENVKVYLTPEIKGKCDEISIRSFANGINEDHFNITVPGFLISLGAAFINNRELSLSVKSSRLDNLLTAGGDLYLSAKVAIKNPDDLLLHAKNLKIVMWVKPTNCITFPKDIKIPPIVALNGDEKVTLKYETPKFVIGDSKIYLTLLLDNKQIDYYEFFLAKDKNFDTQAELMKLKWQTSSFINENTELGEHTLQVKIEFTEADNKGDEIGSAVIMAPEQPKRFIVLDQSSAADYYPTCFAQILGTSITDEDKDQSWDMSWQGTLFKNAPDPAMDRTMARASKCFGILPDSVKYTVEWGDDSPPMQPEKLKTTLNSEYQPIQFLNHTYTQPGKYNIKSNITYTVRRFEPYPNIDEITEWKPVDEPGHKITASMMLTVTDTTPPVINDDNHVLDNPPYRSIEPMLTCSGLNFDVSFIVEDNTEKDTLRSVKLFTKFQEQWLERPANSITLVSPPGALPKVFDARCTFKIPITVASKEPFFQKFPFYIEAEDVAGNINDGDRDIRDNDSPPRYNADGPGPAGYMVVYDHTPPHLNFSYQDPTTKDTIEHTFLPVGTINREVKIEKYITKYGEAEKSRVYSKSIPDNNSYPVKSISEAKFPIVLPDLITIFEDRRLQFNIDARDFVDDYNINVEFLIDGISAKKSETGKLSMPIIFREPGDKVFEIVIYDKKNVDNSFNPLRVQIKVIVKNTHLSVHTLEKSN